MIAAGRGVAPILAVLLAFPAAIAGQAPPPAAQRHAVRIQSQPAVEILWEGVALGETDARGFLLIEGIPEGEYRLTLRREGFRTLDTRITVAPGTGRSRALMLEPLAPRAVPREGAGGTASNRTTAEVDRPPAPAAEPSPGETAEAPGATSVAEPVENPSAENLTAESVAGTSPPTTGTGTTEPPGRQPERAGDRPGADERATAPGESAETSTRPFSPLQIAAALLLALVAGAAGARFLSGSRGDGASEEIPLFEEAFAGPATARQGRDAPGFLEDLKQREQNFPDRPDVASPRPEETIIEVEAVEIRPGDKA